MRVSSSETHSSVESSKKYLKPMSLIIHDFNYPIQFVKGKGFFVCDVRVAAHTQNCPKNGSLKARLMA